MTATYINLGSKNISFQSGNTYRFGSNVTVSVVNTVFLSVVHPAAVTEKINAGDFVLVSGSFGLGASSTLPIQTSIETTSVGTTLQIEQAAAEAARRDTQLAAKVNVHTQQIADLETAAAGKAVIDDTSTATDKVLSAAKTIELIGDAQTAAQTFATTAASDAASALIDDASTATGKVWSASKTSQAIADAETNAKNSAVEQILGGATNAQLDTIKELADSLTNLSGDGVGAINAAIAKRVSVDAQTWTSAEQAQARTNIGAISSDEATTIANDRIAAVVGDPATSSVTAIFASQSFTLA